MTSITIAISDEQMKQLQDKANLLKVELQDLIRVSLNELLAQPDDDLRRAIDHVLTKNENLYRRLA